MGTYARLAELPVEVDGWSTALVERETGGGSGRATTVFSLEGGGRAGHGEDVTYGREPHEALADRSLALGLVGEWTLESASAHLDGVDLVPDGPPARTVDRNYRRWGLESALLDLALKQADADLAAALDRIPEPVRFVVSTGLGDPASAAPVTRWLEVDPNLAFKGDVTRPLDDTLLATLVDTDAIRSIDLKAQYASEVPTADDGSIPSWVGDPDPDPTFYRTLLEAFPDAVVEDPAVTDRTRPVLEPVANRVSWDAPVHSVAEFEALGLDVGWCNVKPSRFGRLERLLDFIDYGLERGLGLYGGGQFELSVGRGQLHDLASLFYPDGPNDVAPRPYNDPEPRAGLPSSPLDVPDRVPGFGWPVDDAT